MQRCSAHTKLFFLLSSASQLYHDKRPWTKPQSSWFSLFLSWVQTKHQSIIARRCTRCSASCVSYCCDDMVNRRRLVRCLDRVCFMSFDHWVTIGPPANSIIAWAHRSCVRWNKWQMISCWSGLARRSSEKAPRMKRSVIGTNGMRSTQTVTTRYDLNHLHCYLTSLSFHKMQLHKMQLSKSTSKQDRRDPQFIRNLLLKLQYYNWVWKRPRLCRAKQTI